MRDLGAKPPPKLIMCRRALFWNHIEKSAFIDILYINVFFFRNMFPTWILSQMQRPRLSWFLKECKYYQEKRKSSFDWRLTIWLGKIRSNRIFHKKIWDQNIVIAVIFGRAVCPKPILKVQFGMIIFSKSIHRKWSFPNIDFWETTWSEDVQNIFLESLFIIGLVRDPPLMRKNKNHCFMQK